MSRVERERRTVQAMIKLYCRRHHNSKALCPECGELADYAGKRLTKCPYGEGKTTCAKCPTHCYKPEMRARIRTVMRYSGPRMIWHHPLAAVQHLVDERRKEPALSRGQK